MAPVGTKKERTLKFQESLALAIKDYSDLLRKGYPDRRTLDLVADRYHLDRAGRAVLFRGVFREEQNRMRNGKAMQGDPAGNAHVMVDALNQLYSIASYLSGQLVFIASDGFLRDASGFHGEPLQPGILERSVHALCSIFQGPRELTAEFLLDARADALNTVRDAMVKAVRPLAGRVKVIESDSVDAALSNAKDCILATSDSTIIDRTDCPVFDLARQVLQDGYLAKIPAVAQLLARK